MLSELTIQNIAVIQQAAIRFGRGFNVFTGETGAGKSILLGAIGAVLGERVSRDLIRTGENKAAVSALFTGLSEAAAEAVRALDFGIEFDDELLLQRNITADGNSCRINGQAATVAMLRSVGAALITTHGQQDSQMLSSPDNHRRFVDAFGGLAPLLADYRTSYDGFVALQRRLDAAVTDEAARERRIELLRYQIDEIEACDLSESEEEELTGRRHVIRNAAALTESLSRCRENLCGNDEVGGALALLDDTARGLEEAGRHMPDLSAMGQTVEGFRYELDDIAERLRGELEGLCYDPRELDDIEERLDTIGRLKRKYGDGVAAILHYCDRARAELEEMEYSDETRQRLLRERDAALADTERRAKALSMARADSARRLIEAVTAELTALDMPSVRLDISLAPKRMGETGADAVEFLLSVNPGETPRPLAKIASGGEMSRIMLAIKSVISGRDDIDTLIFDEVDAGVSGRAAQKVGAKLRAVSRERQVICVTHLAQVAAFADEHLLIEKMVLDGRTFTEVMPLDRGGRVRELARITSGEPVTELALRSAEELLKLSQKG